MTQELQEALANEAAFTRVARDTAQQLQVKLADAESRVDFFTMFLTTQVRRWSEHGALLCSTLWLTCSCRATT